MVIDDEELEQDILSLLLEDSGFTVAVAAQGIMPAYDAMRSWVVRGRPEIGVVFMDLRMPPPNGLDAIKQLAISHPNIVPVVVSGHVSKRDAEACRAAGVEIILHKPWDDEDIIEALCKAIALHREKKAVPAYAALSTHEDDW
ncbi:MAG: response regulator [bacterium]|nr:response regulator [bacterium]